MDYHSRIMNIERDPMKVAAAPKDAAYSCGHRDARHAAAEITLEADAEIAGLLEALEIARDYMSNDISAQQVMFKGYEKLGRIPELLAELALVDSVIKATKEKRNVGG